MEPAKQQNISRTDWGLCTPFEFRWCISHKCKWPYLSSIVLQNHRTKTSSSYSSLLHLICSREVGRNALFTSHCTWAASPADNPSSSSAQVLPVLTGFFDGRQQEGQGHLRPRSYVWRTTRKIAAGLSALVSRLHRRMEELTGMRFAALGRRMLMGNADSPK